MKRTTLFAHFGAIVVCAGAVAFAPAGSGGFDFFWHTIDSGGGTSEGGDFGLTGTIGQHDGGGPSTGGDFSLVGGFWANAGDVTSTCPEDLDGDGVVAFSDLLMVLAAWGACPIEGPCPEDLNGDGDVAFSDLLILLAAWGPCP